jgi:class 3 adenylate cyclase/predicted ATPase
MHCPACHSRIAEGSVRCAACGSVLALSCPSCGEANRPGAYVCSRCSHALTRAQVDLALAPPHLAPPQPGAQVSASAERRQLTVMFCDLAGSTELASRLDPEDLREVVGAVLRRLTEVVTVFNGFVADYMGDGALIYFGYPEAHENDAECAIRAALQAEEEVSSLALLNGYRPRVRIGIATGLVVVGATGGTGIDAIRNAAGATPNLAARLQALAEPGAVVVASSTRALAGRLFEYRDLGLASLKGFSEPVRAWQVIGTAPAESRFEAQHDTKLGPLVGREEEAAVLSDLWRRTCRGTGRVVLLSGEPGVGKSRLTAMLMDRLAGEVHIRLRYFCSPHLQGSPLHPCIQQLERAAGFTRGDSPARKLERLEAALLKETTSLEDIALFADLLSLPTGERYPTLQFSPQKRKEKTMEALVRQLDLLSSRHPLLMIFEDAHWSDPTTRDLLHLVVDLIAQQPIMLIVTFRPEFQAAWTSRKHVSAIVLRPLPRAQSVVLVEQIAGAGTLPRELMEDIVDRSDGVPLYIEELTKAVLEASVQDESKQDMVARVARRAMAVPATLHASLLTRLDRLGDAKEVAQIGAALGREFSFELLAALAQRPMDALCSALDRLTQSGLVFATGTPPHATYLFKHALVQDAAYDTMLRATRLKLHQRIVDLLELESPELSEVQPEILAHHCTEAGLVRKALGYWLKAGHRALMRSTMVEAVARLEKGLSLIERLPESAWRHQQELDYQIARGKALIATKGYAESITGATFARAHQLCDLLNQPPQLLAVLHGEWTHALLRGELASAHQRATDLLKQGEARGDELWTLMGCRFVGVTCFPLGEFAAGRDHLERGLKLFDPTRRSTYAALTVDDAQVVMQTYLAYALLYLGDVDQARAQCQAALAEARRLSQPYSLTHALIGSTYIELYLGYPSAALEHLKELLSLTSEHRIAYYGAFGTIFRGVYLASLGQAEEAIEVLTQGLAAYRATGSGLYLPSFLTWLADAHGKAGRPAYGLKLIEEAVELLELTQMRNDEAEIHRLRAELLLAVHDTAAAEASFRKALEVAQRQKAKLLALRAAMGLAQLWRDQGSTGRARELLSPVHDNVTEGRDVPIFREATALIDTLC